MIVDASVAVKFFTPEQDDDIAERLANTEALAAPDLIVAEVANAFWRMVRQKRFSAPPSSLDLLPRFIPELVMTINLMADALKLAIDLDHPVYDCFYLALAVQRNDRLVTADARFLAALAGTAHAARVTALAEWKPG